jgi:hypothetical protein
MLTLVLMYEGTMVDEWATVEVQIIKRTLSGGVELVVS